MHESELLFQVSQIVSATNSFTRAVDKIRSLLEQTLGARTLTVVGASDFTGNASLEETRFQWWKASPLRAGGRELGKLLVSSDVPDRVSNYTGEQLGMLLERIQLAKERQYAAAPLGHHSQGNHPVFFCFRVPERSCHVYDAARVLDRPRERRPEHRPWRSGSQGGRRPAAQQVAQARLQSRLRGYHRSSRRA
jgi:hypothetical protein